VKDLVGRLRRLRESLQGCESLTIATRDGFVLASTAKNKRDGEMLAAVTSVVIGSCSRGLAPFRVGECQTLDFRGDRQLLITFLGELQAYLVCVLNSGATPINPNEPVLRGVVTSLPDVLHGSKRQSPPRFYLQRDDACLIPIRSGLTIGKQDTCDIVVPGRRVDPMHLRFEIFGSKVLVRDLATQHGTKLNRRQFNGTHELSPGDRLSLPRAGGFTVVSKEPAGRLVGLTKRVKKKRPTPRPS
jgi:predicted regulator of Ras-like GTPase activity (Roadblock/LC7/MglB family)